MGTFGHGNSYGHLRDGVARLWAIGLASPAISLRR